MTSPTAHERVRSALDAIVSGKSSPLAFDGFIADMIASRVLTRSDARVELEAAVRDGTIPPDCLRRLGLDNGEATHFSVARTGDAPRGRHEDQTQVRVFAVSPVAAEPSPVGEDALPMFARPAPVETDSVWIEPGSAAAGQRAGTGVVLGNRYRLECKLGEGGMGVVYRATDLEVKGESFAVKVLKPAIRERPESLKVMREEVRKTRALRHPNIVGVYSLNSDPAGVYMLMEYLEGKSLSALIDEDFRRGMPMMRAWPLIHDIGSALAYAHDHNVIHSDLKPSNLFLTVSGKAMLLDFGIARAVRTRAGRFDTGSLGALTPAYASSEMLSGSAPDQTDDVYSFACVIYEILTGRHPFNGLGALDAQKGAMCPTPVVSLTARQNQALAGALAFERAQRTGSVEALLKGLEPSPIHSEWLHKWSRMMGLGAAVVAVCLVAAVGAWMMLRKPASERARTASVPAAPIISQPAPAPAPIAAPLPPVTQAAPLPKPGLAPELGQPSIPLSATENPPSIAPAPHADSHRAAAVERDVRHVSASMRSGAAAAPASTDAARATAGGTTAPSRTGSAADPDTPPLGKKLPAIIPLPDSSAKLASCPYPDEARRLVETGTVVLLVHVSPDGGVASTHVETSSGSPSLDQGAGSCVEQFAQFAPKIAGKPSAGYWGRMKFNWSFGD
jgi:TonB family protein